MLLRYLFFFSLILPLRLLAQQEMARLELGARDAKPEFYEYSPVDKGLVTLGAMTVVSSRQVGIVKYDRNLKREWSREVFEQNGRKHVDQLTVIGTHIFVFVSEYFPKEKVIKTSYYSFNLDGKTEKKEELLAVYPNQASQKVDLEYTLSPNKTRLLCYKNLRSRREAEQILYYLFDDSGELIQNGEMKFKYPDDKLQIRDLRVSNQGNVFALGAYYKDGVQVDSYQYLLSYYNRVQNKMSEIQIDFGRKKITDLAFRIDKDENAYVAGFYSNIDVDRIVGTVFQKIGMDGKILQETAEEFSDEFKANFLSQRQIDKGKELQDFRMNKDGIMLRSDGGVMLMAERYYQTSQTYRDMYGGWYQQTIHHNDEIILTSINAMGKIEWHSIIDKTQTDTNPDRLSFFPAVGENGVYIFYEYSGRKQGNNIFYHVTGVDGKTTARLPLYKDYKWNNIYYPKYGIQISNNESLFVYFTKAGKGLVMSKVKLN